MPPYLGAAILLLVFFIFGHALDVAQAPIGTRYNVWEKQYGLTYQLKGPFGKNTLIVNDPKGMNHVLQGRNYQRNSGDTELIKICFGHSLFSAEGMKDIRFSRLASLIKRPILGEEHRMMRKTVSGALS
ncbi:hypothetical protein MPER_11375, partial [Moniliophthora perniciosa FA553]